MAIPFQPYNPTPLAYGPRPEVLALTRTIIERANKQMLIGLVMIVAGATVSIWTYENAKPGGTFVVLWGLVVFGVVRCVKALRSRQRAYTTALRAYEGR